MQKAVNSPIWADGENRAVLTDDKHYAVIERRQCGRQVWYYGAMYIKITSGHFRLKYHFRRRRSKVELMRAIEYSAEFEQYFNKPVVRPVLPKSKPTIQQKTDFYGDEEPWWCK